MTDVFEAIRVSDIMCDTRRAFMIDVYGLEEWRKCISYLLDRGMEPVEVVELLRSKHMRWADDTRDWNLEEPTHSQVFIEYFEKNEMRIWENLREWTNYT